jgi:hypothetical protein
MSWITFDNLKRFWKGIRTNPVTFTGEIDLQNTTRYKGKEIATKADITDNSITVDNALSGTSTNPVQNKVINSKFNMYAPKASPAFTGVVTATDVKVSTSLTIPGGKVWIK